MIRKFVLGAAIMMAGLLGTAGATLAAPAAAHAATAPAHVVTAPVNTAAATLTSVTAVAAHPDSNDCGLPTQADPGSYFVGSYSSCWLCIFDAYLYNGNPYIVYYCTYNPSNGLTDLHYTDFYS